MEVRKSDISGENMKIQSWWSKIIIEVSQVFAKIFWKIAAGIYDIDEIN